MPWANDRSINSPLISAYGKDLEIQCWAPPPSTCYVVVDGFVVVAAAAAADDDVDDCSSRRNLIDQLEFG